MFKSEWLYPVSLLIGALLGIAIRKASDQSSHDRLYRVLSDIIVLFLLPFHVFTATLRAAAYNEIASGVALLAWGVVLCISTFWVATWLCGKAALRSFGPTTPFVAATFAGGGRAVLIAAVLSPLVDFAGLFHYFGANGTVIDALAIADVGYWLFYLAVIAGYLMKKTLAANPYTDPRNKLANYRPIAVLIGGFLGLIGIFVNPALADHQYLALGRWIVTSLIVLLAALTFALRFSLDGVGGATKDIAFILVSRLMGFAVALGLAWFVYPSQFWQFLLVALIFFVSPPSSLVDKLMFEAGATQAQADRAIQVGVTWNVGFLFLVVFLFAFSSLVVRSGMPQP